MFSTEKSNFILRQYQQLTSKHISQLEQLVGTCHKADGYSVKLNWEIILNRQTSREYDWFAEFDGQPVAYLGFFAFDDQPIQISLLVHPQYRRQGIAKQLWAMAQQTLSTYGLNSCEFYIPIKAAIAITWLEQQQASQQEIHEEWLITDLPKLPLAAFPHVKLRKAAANDIETLVKTHAVGFNNRLDFLYRYYHKQLSDQKNYCWLAYNTHQQLIGIACTELLTSQQQLISNFTILPEYRKQNYAPAFFLNLLHELKPTAEQPVQFQTVIKNLKLSTVGMMTNSYYRYSHTFATLYKGKPIAVIKDVKNHPLWEKNYNSLMAELATLYQVFYDYIHKFQLDQALSEPLKKPQAINLNNQPNNLTQLCQQFNLSTFEKQLILLCLAIEIKPYYARLYQLISGNSNNKFVTLDIAMRLFNVQNGWEVFEPQAPLRYWRLIEMHPGYNFTSSPLRLAERVLHYLMQTSTIDAGLQSWLQPVTVEPIPLASHQSAAKIIIKQWQESADDKTVSAIQLIGAEPTRIQQTAKLVAAYFNSSLWQANLYRLIADNETLDSKCKLLERELLLSDAILILNCQALEEQTLSACHRQALLGFIDQLITSCQTHVILTADRIIQGTLQSVQVLKLSQLTHAELVGIWQYHLGETAPFSAIQLNNIVVQFQLNILQIANLAEQWQKLPRVADNNEEYHRLWQLCRQHFRQNSIATARLIEPQVTWNDFFIAPRQSYLLKQLINQVKHRYTVYRQWNFAGKSERGLGVVALLSGPSGTGKTMAAEVIASELQLDLLHVDLSTVISKYIGDTQKNLNEVFSMAEASGAVLLFDEADALFSKRREIRDSRDHTANQEISYLLQRIEAYQGLTILTTNIKNAIDPAFLHRFHTIIDFAELTKEERIKIWQTVLPEKFPHDVLNFDELAGYLLNGREIRMITINAAFKAAEEQTPLSMKHVKEAIMEVCEKLETTFKLTSKNLKN